MKDKMTVSVAMPTYGQENYIIDAIEGVLIQKISFDIELIITNDNSPDKTDELIQKFLKERQIPSKIAVKYIVHENNKGAIPNFIWTVRQCIGRYVAICEGDDYWTDPLKLQKQVDFLEENPEYIIHSGKAQIKDEQLTNRVIGDPLNKGSYSISDFYTKNNFVTCTSLFKNIPIEANVFDGLAFGDWMLYISLFKHFKGKFGFVTDDVLSVYRMHSGGVMHGLSHSHKYNQAHVTQIIAIGKQIDANYSFDDCVRINNYFISVFSDILEKRNYRKAMELMWRNFILNRKLFPLRNYLGLLKNHLLSS